MYRGPRTDERDEPNPEDGVMIGELDIARLPYKQIKVELGRRIDVVGLPRCPEALPIELRAA